MDVKDKVILITGASQGIGKATAELLASQGAHVAVAARSVDLLYEIANNFENGLVIEADMTQPESITAMVEQVVKHYGRIDVLINNAARSLIAPVEKIKTADFNNIMQLNLYGPLLAMQAVIPHMQEKGGTIINVSSTVPKMAIPNIGVYAASKGALDGLSLTARAELAEKNITVSLMYPWQTVTNLGKNSMVYENIEMKRPPNMQPNSPEQVAEKILEVIKSGAAEQYMLPEHQQRYGLRTSS